MKYEAHEPRGRSPDGLQKEVRFQRRIRGQVRKTGVCSGPGAGDLPSAGSVCTPVTQHCTTELKLLCKCSEKSHSLRFSIRKDPWSARLLYLVCGHRAHNSSWGDCSVEGRGPFPAGLGPWVGGQSPGCGRSGGELHPGPLQVSWGTASGQQRSLVPMATGRALLFPGKTSPQRHGCRSNAYGLSQPRCPANPERAAGHPGQRSQVLPRCGVGAQKEVLARPGSQEETHWQQSPCFPLGPVPQPTMSSASSEPGNGDSAERSRLGLDAVIQVSGVAAIRHPPGSRPQGHLGRERTLHREATAPRLQGALSTCSRGQHEHARTHLTHTHRCTHTHTGAHRCRLCSGQEPGERLNWGPGA